MFLRMIYLYTWTYMPKPDYIIGLPEDIRKEFMNRPVKCPYTKGKMTLQKIKKRSIDAIKEVIWFLGKRTKSFKTYDEYNAQMNDEKATEYILQSQIFQLWTATANKIVNYASDEITVKDIRAMITLDYWTVIAILQTKFSMINIIIKENYLLRKIKKAFRDQSQTQNFNVTNPHTPNRRY